MKVVNSFVNFVALLILILSPISTFSQQSIDFDYASFKYDSTQSVAEIYYAVPVVELTFVEVQSKNIQAQIMVKVSIKTDEKVWADNAWKMEKTLTDTSEIKKTGHMVDVLRYLLKPGVYNVSFYVEDLNKPGNTFTNQKNIVVKDFLQEKPGLSDIQFANSIKKAKKNPDNVFWKNGKEIIPNPGLIYSKTSPVLYYYLESYNLNNALEGNLYKNRYFITDSDGQLVEKIKSREQRKKVIDSNIEIGQVYIAALQSGTYNFNFGIYNDQDSLILSNTKKFFIYNPDVDETIKPVTENIETAILNSRYANMNDKQLNEEFELTRYFTTDEEQDLYKKLEGVEAKRRFIYQVWKKRDPVLQSPVNEFEIGYRQRIEQANIQYRSYARKGWRTDRGRVFIYYGSPTDVERYPNNPVSYAYEIWHYEEIEGGVIFVFIDTQEYGEYYQVHSTKRGELSNTNWEKLVQK